ncbi:hypothetical protein [Agromyces bauzanensis]
MSDRNEPVEQPGTTQPHVPTDDLEGRYTEVDDEQPETRGVAGTYTRTEGFEHDDTVVGDYTETAEHPTTHDASERHGKYVRTDRPPGGK